MNEQNKIEAIELTTAGIGEPDGCWIWHDGALHQIEIQDSQHGEIHSLRMECHKGDWSLIPETIHDSVLWQTLAMKVARKLKARQEVV
jgi:hypothetical protein